MKLPAAKRVRELRGMTQTELAEASGTSLKTIVNVEGGHSVRTTTARKLAEALNVSVTVLAGVEPFPAERRVHEPEAPALQLEAMYVTDAATRHRALEAASDKEVARYTDTIERVIRDVLRGIPEWEETAVDESKSEDARRVAREQADRLWGHIDHLTRLRSEATSVDDEPRPQEDLADLLAHAGVGAGA
jgi:transcriptional regulator with XRE-family HTH domain